MLPIKSCSYKINHIDTAGVSPHTHNFTSEIIQTFSDGGKVLINGVLYEMKKNGLYFIYGKSVHFVCPEDIDRYNHSIITLNTEEIEVLCKQLGMWNEYEMFFLNKGGFFCALSEEDVIKCDSVFLKIKNVMTNDVKMKYAHLTLFFSELVFIASEYTEKIETSDTKIGEILSYVSEHAFEKISINDICKSTHISKYHLCRIFKENTGVTIGEFIKKRRLAAAKLMLTDSNLPVNSIASRCGFSDSSFFSKTFSKEFKISPTEFRMKYKKGLSQ